MHALLVIRDFAGFGVLLLGAIAVLIGLATTIIHVVGLRLYKKGRALAAMRTALRLLHERNEALALLRDIQLSDFNCDDLVRTRIRKVLKRRHLPSE